jgi:hypothetical protein
MHCLGDSNNVHTETYKLGWSTFSSHLDIPLTKTGTDETKSEYLNQPKPKQTCLNILPQPTKPLNSSKMTKDQMDKEAAARIQSAAVCCSPILSLLHCLGTSPSQGQTCLSTYILEILTPRFFHDRQRKATTSAPTRSLPAPSPRPTRTRTPTITATPTRLRPTTRLLPKATRLRATPPPLPPDDTPTKKQRTG